jgi:hypothetical protein
MLVVEAVVEFENFSRTDKCGIVITFFETSRSSANQLDGQHWTRLNHENASILWTPRQKEREA